MSFHKFIGEERVKSCLRVEIYSEFSFRNLKAAKSDGKFVKLLTALATAKNCVSFLENTFKVAN